MNIPITLCDRCEEYARCALNYDGDNCRRSRTVEPTNSDLFRSMTDEEMATLISENIDCAVCENVLCSTGSERRQRNEQDA